MKTRFLFFKAPGYFAAILIVLYSLNIPAHGQTVLWIGNSYTGFNHLPELFKAMAWQYGFTPQVDSHLVGGSSLYMHAQDSAVISLLLSKPWDVVILQPNGIETSRPLDTVIAKTLPHLKTLDSLARLSNNCVQTLIYQPFNRILGATNNCQIDPIACTYLGASARTIANTDYMSLQTGIPVVRAGSAFRAHFLQGNALNLWHPDNLHSTYEGSFLAESMFYQAVYGLNPVLNHFVGQNNFAAARDIKKLAKAVFDTTQYSTLPRLNPYNLSIAVTNSDDQTTTVSASSTHEVNYTWQLNGTPAGNLTSVNFSNVSRPTLHLQTIRYDTGCFAGSYQRFFSNQANGNSARRFISAVNVNNYSTMVGQQLGYSMKNDTVQADLKGQLYCSFSPGYDTKLDSAPVVWQVYLDTNNNGVFANTEMIFQTPNSNKPVQATMPLPPALAAGTYKLRVLMYDPAIKDNTNTNIREYEGAAHDFFIELKEAACDPQLLHPFKVTTYTESSAEVVWPVINGISRYRVQIQYPHSSTWTNRSIIDGNSTIYEWLEPGQVYRFRIAPLQCSDVLNFTPEVVYTQPTVVKTCSRPEAKTLVTTPTEVHFSWLPMSGVSLYQVRYKPVGTAGSYTNIHQIQNTSVVVKNLFPGTGYDFQVRALCTSNNTWTNYSVYSTTTTTGEAPIFLQSKELLKLYPNPGYNFAELEAPAGSLVRMCNTQGQVVQAEIVPTNSGYLILTDRLTPGAYIIYVTDDRNSHALFWQKHN
jgi:hypothetical protein